MKTKILLSFLLVIFSFHSAKASHAWGGDISWRCLPNGQFVFKLNFYCDCAGIPCPQTASLNVINHPTVLTIPLAKLFGTNFQNPNGCNGCLMPNGFTAVDLNVYESAPITLAGTPPDSGWVFEWGSCCRSATILNITNPGSFGFLYRSIMYPNNLKNTNPAYDSSPHFLTSPQAIVCAGIPTNLSFAAHDPDGDSLVYSLVPIPGLPYAAGYSGTSPLPGPAQNPNNVGVSINPQTGELSFTSFTTGVFITYVKVESYRCGIKIAEVYRDYSISIVNAVDCQLPSGLSNWPPIIQPAFQNSSGQLTEFSDTLMVGDSIEFDIAISDTNTIPSSLQNVFLNIKSIVLNDSLLAPIINCALPPCANISPSVPIGPVSFATTASINWTTACSNLMTKDSCFDISRQIDFEVIYQDDHCPLPGYGAKILSVLVQDIVPAATPQLDSITILPNGDVNLFWTPPSDPNSVFTAYYIYFANDSLGPFTILDSITSYSQNTYTHVGANGNTVPVYYKMSSKSSIICQPNYESPSSNRVSNIIYLGISNNVQSNAIYIYPNPVIDILNIESELFLQENVSIEIRNLFGQVIKEIKADKNLTQKIDIVPLNNGIYILNLNKLHSFKFVKQ